MIEFRQKCFTEYDAMRSLYVRLVRDDRWRNRVRTIDKSALLPILGGNNVVIERFVISKTFFGTDRYRMYLRLGAKVKLPNKVRLPGHVEVEKFGEGSFKLNGKLGTGHISSVSEINKRLDDIYEALQKTESIPSSLDNQTIVKFFSKTKDKKKGNGGGNNGGGYDYLTTEIRPYLNLSTKRTVSLGDTVKYEPKERLLVLEFSSIDEAVSSLDILPFGINYNLYLLEP